MAIRLIHPMELRSWHPRHGMRTKRSPSKTMVLLCNFMWRRIRPNSKVVCCVCWRYSEDRPGHVGDATRRYCEICGGLSGAQCPLLKQLAGTVIRISSDRRPETPLKIDVRAEWQSSSPYLKHSPEHKIAVSHDVTRSRWRTVPVAALALPVHPSDWSSHLPQHK